MAISIRSWLSPGVAVLTAAAMALVPCLTQPHEASRTAAQPAMTHIASPPVQLTASVQPALAAGSLPNLLVGWLERIAVPPSAGQPLPTPQFPPSVGGTSIDSTIKNVYNAVEPWVQYGFELATYAVGWIPGVGWLAPQIMIFYNFGERIVRSITFNVADLLGGNVGFVQGLVNVGRDTINSFIQLGIDELHFFLPPLPPLPFAAKQATTRQLTSAKTQGPVKSGGVTALDTANKPREPRAAKDTQVASGVAVRAPHGRGATAPARAASHPRRSAATARTA